MCVSALVMSFQMKRLALWDDYQSLQECARRPLRPQVQIQNLVESPKLGEIHIKKQVAAKLVVLTL